MLRKNTIQLLENNGVEHRSHSEKEAILYSYYTSLLGTTTPAAWAFDLSIVYPNHTLSLSSLSSPFTLPKSEKPSRA